MAEVAATQDTPEEVVDDLGATIRAQFEKATETVSGTPTEPAAEAAPVAEAPKVDTRARNPDGTFAKTDAERAAAAKATAAIPATPAVDPTAPAAKSFKQPLGWKDTPDAWNALPQTAKEYMAQREADYNRGIQQHSQMAKVGQVLINEFQPYEGLLNALGANPASASRFLLNAYATLKTGTPAQKAQIIAGLAQEEGIDLASIVQNGVPQEDPRYLEISRQNQQILQMLRQRDQAERSQQQYHQQSEIHSHIDAFAADPAHEHFETVRPTMVLALQSGQAKTLKEAYDIGCWANPSIRASLISQRDAQEMKKRKEEAEAAKRADVSVPGAPTGPGAGLGDLSLRDAIARQMGVSA